MLEGKWAMEGKGQWGGGRPRDGAAAPMVVVGKSGRLGVVFLGVVLAEVRCSCPVNVEGRKQRPSEVKFGVLGKSVLAKRQALSALTDNVTRSVIKMAISREVHSVRREQCWIDLW